VSTTEQLCFPSLEQQQQQVFNLRACSLWLIVLSSILLLSHAIDGWDFYVMLKSLLDLPKILFILVRFSISFRSWKICCVQSVCSVCSWAGWEGWQLQWSWWQIGFQVWSTFKAGSTSTITICLYPFRVNSFYLYTICVAPWITVKKHWWMDDLANWGSAFPHRIVDIFCKKNTWVDMCIDSQLNSRGRLLYWWPIFLPFEMCLF
jgi:hypothetical protein